jgi:hypothetical protein
MMASRPNRERRWCAENEDEGSAEVARTPEVEEHGENNP